MYACTCTCTHSLFLTIISSSVVHYTCSPHVYVYMYIVRTRTVHVCTHTRIRTHTRTHTYARTHAHTHARTHTHTHTAFMAEYQKMGGAINGVAQCFAMESKECMSLCTLYKMYYGNIISLLPYIHVITMYSV